MLTENVKRYRLERGLSQEKRAQKAGVTYSILTKIECWYDTNPKVMNIVKLAKALGVTVTDLLGA